MLVSAYILSAPVWPVLGQSRAIACGTVYGPFGAVLRPRRVNPPGGLLDRLPGQSGAGQSAPVRINGPGSIGAPGRSNVPGFAVNPGACRAHAARARGVILLPYKPPRACTSAQCRIRENPQIYTPRCMRGWSGAIKKSNPPLRILKKKIRNKKNPRSGEKFLPFFYRQLRNLKNFYDALLFFSKKSWE